MRRVMVLIAAAAVCWVTVAQADAKDDAKERRKARREQVEQLVTAGDAKEGADGYLEAKEALESSKAELVKAENADRRVGYEAIAKANNKSTEEVGRKASEINRARSKKR